MKTIITRLAAFVALALAGSFAATAPAQAADDVVIVYDASGSMWGQIDGTSKIEIARDVMADLVNNWAEDTNVGLIAYGHRRQGDCSDIETLIKPGPLDKSKFISTVKAIKPVGKTPITAAVQQAADLLSYRDKPATVILISDGVETCNADPCALSAQLEKQGVKFTAHVVGFDLKKEENARLSCIAENTGGVFVPASNASELKDALAQVQSAVELQPATPEPTPEPELPAAAVEISAPSQVTRGARFTVGWTPTFEPRDYVTIVPADAKEGTYKDYVRVGENSEGDLTAPAETGLYELRYMRDEDHKTLGAASIEVVEADVTLTGPEQVTTGANFDVSWTGAVNPRDFITTVPTGAKEGTYKDYIRTGDKSGGTLTAPAEPGLYELRYLLNKGYKTLATAPLEVVSPEVGLKGPAQVTTGATFDVSWVGAVNSRDFITIVPAGAKEGTYKDYIRTGDKTTGTLTAPAEPGLYELRYLLNKGHKTMATAPLEVVSPEVGLKGPAQVTTGATFDVSWAGAVNSRDFITIVPVGAKEGTYKDYIRTGDNSAGTLTAPAEPGLYELRYLLNKGHKTMATAPLEVVSPEVGLSGPAQVTAGAKFDVSWAGAVNTRDFITIVPAGAKEGTYKDYIRTGDKSAGTLTAPAQPGLYELRYLLNKGHKTLASVPFEVVEPTLTLTGPALVRAETPVTIEWSETINSRDLITIVPAGAKEGSHNDYFRAGDKTKGELKAPATPGLYEIRYVLEKGRKTLASAPLEVVGADAPLDDGAGLSVPESAAPGAVITVTWTGGNDSADQRLAVARKDQPDFTWISVHKIGAQKSMDLTMPEEPGIYEVRYLDVAGRALLGRSVIQVK